MFEIDLYFILEIIGTIAFAISGAMVAIENKMDILGVLILGVTTAIGGGIIRDILIGSTPPTALINPLYSLIAFGVAAIVFIPAIRRHVNVNHKWFVFIDSLGLGVFTVIGLKTAMPFNNVLFELFLGVLTGVGGGVIRDVFATQKPMIFVRHFYAAASLSGAIVCIILFPINETLAMISGIAVTLILRLLAAQFKWHLPKA